MTVRCDPVGCYINSSGKYNEQQSLPGRDILYSEHQCAAESKSGQDHAGEYRDRNQSSLIKKRVDKECNKSTVRCEREYSFIVAR